MRKMTKKEAAALIIEHKAVHKMNEPRAIHISEALDMAIQALEQKSCTLDNAREDIDKEEVSKAVVLLDLFTKTFCRYRNDYERFNDLKFRCEKCPFQKENAVCLVKVFKCIYAPDYRDFGSMGNL